MKVLLINPPYNRLCEMPNLYLPLGLASLAAYIEKDHEVKLYNTELPAKNEIRKINIKNILNSKKIYEQNLHSNDHIVWKEITQILKEYKPQLVGFSVLSCKYVLALKLTKLVKNISEEIITVWGGPHCSADGEHTLGDNECIDYVIPYEGETSFASLLKSLENDTNKSEIPNLIYRENDQVILNQSGPLIENLNELPYPVRNTDVFQERYPDFELGGIMTSRGCPYNCAFCDSAKVWGRKVRFRSAENIVNELSELNSKYGVSNFHFYDDTFTIIPKRTIEFCNFLVKSGLKIGYSCNTRMDILTAEVCQALKDSGVIFVSCGIETGSERMLKYINKKQTKDDIRRGARLLNQHGIDWNAFFMVGFPQETISEIEETRAFWRELRPGTITLSIFTPSPGSALYDETKQLGLLPEKMELHSFSWQNIENHFVLNISKEKFSKIVIELYAEVESYNHSSINLMKKVYKRRKYYYKHFPELFFKTLIKLRRKIN